MAREGGLEREGWRGRDREREGAERGREGQRERAGLRGESETTAFLSQSEGYRGRDREGGIVKEGYRGRDREGGMEREGESGVGCGKVENPKQRHSCHRRLPFHTQCGPVKRQTKRWST